MTMLLMARVHFGEDERMVNEGPLVRGEREGEERVGGGAHWISGHVPDSLPWQPLRRGGRGRGGGILGKAATLAAAALAAAALTFITTTTTP